MRRQLRISLLAVSAALLLAGLGATQALAAFEFETFDGVAKEQDGTFDVQAGSHPFAMSTDVRFHTILAPLPFEPEVEIEVPDEGPKDLEVSLPPGSIGNPQATPRCTQAQLALVSCPNDTAVGTTELELAGVGFSGPLPVYNVVPPPGLPARFAFNLVTATIAIDAHVRSGSDYGLTTTIHGIPQTFTLIGSNLTFWGVPADHGHDALRGSCAPNITNEFNPPASECPSDAEPRPFLTLPSNCSAGPLTTTARADSWQHPGQWVGASFVSHVEGGAPAGVEGCGSLHFHPRISVQPQSSAAETPSGVSIELENPQSGGPTGLATPNLKRSVTVLPEGLSINASAANGLSGCSPAQIGLNDGTAPTCPSSSKIGTVEIESPLMATPMKGSIFEASQGDNPFGSTLAFYTFSEAEGVAVKLSAQISADPGTGRLTAIVDDAPQLPFSDLRLSFFGGSLAPLLTPPTCGSFSTEERASSWSAASPAEPTPAETATSTSSFQITSGPNGGPCSSRSQDRPFRPSFSAGVQSPVAGSFSSFALRVAREDGTQELATIGATLPPGLLARLAGVPYCPDAQIAAAAARTGAEERAAPSCPAASRVGTVDVGAGAGPSPYFLRGSAYLAGPFKGAPLSLAVITPAVAGPLDLGDVVVRAALPVDPTTAQVGVVSYQLPSILEGIPLKLRSVRVSVDRGDFVRNPTSCEPTSVDGAIGSLLGASAAVADRFQLGGCAGLGFAPRLSLRLSGSARRGGHPALRAVVRTRPEDANIARTVVTLPRTELLDQSHIGTVCTRVQFAARECPAASVYGHARAISPLLDRPLEGPVYLRSSDHPLPDLVADLDGQIRVVVSGRIDSVHGGIRTAIDSVPDAPVSRFILSLRGGAKGLLQNSVALCRPHAPALVAIAAHNGRAHRFRAPLASECATGRGRSRSR